MVSLLSSWRLEYMLENARRRRAWHVTDLLKLIGPGIALALTLAYCFAAVDWVSALWFVQVDKSKVGIFWITNGQRTQALQNGNVDTWVTVSLRATGLIALVFGALTIPIVIWASEMVELWIITFTAMASLGPVAVSLILIPYANDDPSHRQWGWTGLATTSAAAIAQICGATYIWFLHHESKEMDEEDMELLSGPSVSRFAPRSTSRKEVAVTPTKTSKETIETPATGDSLREAQAAALLTTAYAEGLQQQALLYSHPSPGQVIQYH